jgi:hypothetical protein
MTQFILALAAALAILTTASSATKQASHHPVSVTPADVTLPDPV